MQNARETIRKFNGAELKLTEGKSRGEKRIALDFALHRVNLHPVPSIFHRQSNKDFFFYLFEEDRFVVTYYDECPNFVFSPNILNFTYYQTKRRNNFYNGSVVITIKAMRAKCK